MTIIAPCADYSPENCRAALEIALAGKLDFVKPGMRIAIKANLVSFVKPDGAATTHPALLCALCDMLTERGATPVIGDSPGGLFTAVYVNRVYSATGVREAERHGAIINADYSQKTADARGLRLREFEYTAFLDSCDAIINFAKLKTHGMMALSAAVKNMFGAVPGTRKPEYHFKFPDARDFADMLIDIHEFFKPRLSIMDAVIGMEGNGPTSGKPREIGCVIAGENAHALDMACANIVGLREAEVLTLVAARERGLLDDAKLPDNIAEFRVKNYERAVSRDVRFKGRGAFSAIVKLAMGARPALAREKCVSCKRCEEVCPAKAIEFMGKYPVIDRQKCIRCFCCQEFCATAAMQSKRPAVARLLSR